MGLRLLYVDLLQREEEQHQQDAGLPPPQGKDKAVARHQQGVEPRLRAGVHQQAVGLPRLRPGELHQAPVARHQAAVGQPLRGVVAAG